MGKRVARREVEFKSFVFKMDAPPDEQGNFSGYAAVFGNVDKGNDVIEPGAVTKTIKENPEVPVFWAHNYGLVPIGTGNLSLDPKGKGVKIDGQLFLETSELAREVYGAMKAGAVKDMSIGYQTLKRSFKSGIRYLQEIAIGEVSLAPTGFAMNPLAEVESVKSQKWLGQYSATESVDCVLSIIASLTDYYASELSEGDTDDVARLNQIMPLIIECLESEISDLETGLDQEGGDSDPDVVVYVETMTAPIESQIKQLQALLDRGEPARATRQVKRAATKNATEPDTSTLTAVQALAADVHARVAV